MGLVSDMGLGLCGAGEAGLEVGGLRRVGWLGRGDTDCCCSKTGILALPGLFNFLTLPFRVLARRDWASAKESVLLSSGCGVNTGALGLRGSVFGLVGGGSILGFTGGGSILGLAGGTGSWSFFRRSGLGEGLGFGFSVVERTGLGLGGGGERFGEAIASAASWEDCCSCRRISFSRSISCVTCQ